MKSNAQIKRERREMLTALGLCVECGTEPVERFTKCRPCRENHAQRQKAFRQRQQVAA